MSEVNYSQISDADKSSFFEMILGAYKTLLKSRNDDKLIERDYTILGQVCEQTFVDLLRVKHNGVQYQDLKSAAGKEI